MRTRRFTLATALAAAIALVLAGCGGADDPLSDTSMTAPGTSQPSVSPSEIADPATDANGSKTVSRQDTTGAAGPALTGPITVGSANFLESTLLAEIYAGALAAKGIEVEKTLNIGNREAYYQGLLDGSIDLMPEYSGGLLAQVQPDATARSAEDIEAALADALPPELMILEPSAAEDKDALVVTQATAQEYSLDSIDDLAAVAGELVIGGSPEFLTRPDGIPGLEQTYGVTFGEYVVTDAGGNVSQDAIANDRVDVTNLFTTDPFIPANNLVVLDDPESNFRAQIVLPVIRTAVATEEVQAALNAVSAALTTDGLTELLSQASATGNPEQVALDWLAANGLS